MGDEDRIVVWMAGRRTILYSGAEQRDFGRTLEQGSWCPLDMVESRSLITGWQTVENRPAGAVVGV